MEWPSYGTFATNSEVGQIDTRWANRVDWQRYWSLEDCHGTTAVCTIIRDVASQRIDYVRFCLVKLRPARIFSVRKGTRAEAK